MSKLFDFVKTPLKDLYIIKANNIIDDRGFFYRVFCKNEFESIGHNNEIVQINYSRTIEKGTIRGIHFQYPPHVEKKIVSCINGTILDVAIDLRENSPTFLKWYALELSGDNQKKLLIPEGFGHGFQTLTNNCELIYLHTSFYESKSEGGINPQDPTININWPLKVTKISERDKNHPLINESFKGINLL
jgi:dTDP-4-dehydrorhamnose 3,5-epimerase